MAWPGPRVGERGERPTLDGFFASHDLWYHIAQYECLRCGTRLTPDAGPRRVHNHVCPACGGPLRDLALPQE